MRKAILIPVIFLLFSSKMYGQSIPGLPLIPSLDVRDSLVEATLPALAFPAYPTPEATGCVLVCNSPLPLHFLDITAERVDEQRVDVKWETAEELMVQGFGVERSLGNTRHFETIAFLLPAQPSNTANKYAITDDNDYPGISFYRIRETDLDEQFQYSKIVSVKGYDRINYLSIFPNPATDWLGLALYLHDAQTVSIRIYDGIGKIVSHTGQYCNKGTTRKDIGIHSLSRGLYTVEVITAAQERLTVRFIKN